MRTICHHLRAGGFYDVLRLTESSFKHSQVKDVDAEADRTFQLKLAQIRPLPSEVGESQVRTLILNIPCMLKSDKSNCVVAQLKWIRPGLRVLAMYPDTTSFYPATVRVLLTQK